jgi:hypothetical protein
MDPEGKHGDRRLSREEWKRQNREQRRERAESDVEAKAGQKRDQQPRNPVTTPDGPVEPLLQLHSRPQASFASLNYNEPEPNQGCLMMLAIAGAIALLLGSCGFVSTCSAKPNEGYGFSLGAVTLAAVCLGILMLLRHQNKAARVSAFTCKSRDFRNSIEGGAVDSVVIRLFEKDEIVREAAYDAIVTSGPAVRTIESLRTATYRVREDCPSWACETLLDVLGNIGGTEALDIVRDVSKRGSRSLKTAARKALCDGNHRWRGCQCSRCSETRNEEHDWNGCKCSGCGLTRNEGHNWNGCKCSDCGLTRDEKHKWTGCKCPDCGQRRRNLHNWSGCKCSDCGLTRDEGHNYVETGKAVFSDNWGTSGVELRCTGCGRVLHDFR